MRNKCLEHKEQTIPLSEFSSLLYDTSSNQNYTSSNQNFKNVFKKWKIKQIIKIKWIKTRRDFFEGYTIAIEQTLPILIISYRKQRTEKKIPQTNGKKIQLHFLSKKLIHSCQRKRRVDIVIDIPFQYPWYLRSSSIIFAIKLSNRKSNEPRSYIIVSSFTFIERDKMSEWNPSYI